MSVRCSAGIQCSQCGTGHTDSARHLACIRAGADDATAHDTTAASQLPSLLDLPEYQAAEDYHAAKVARAEQGRPQKLYLWEFAKEDEQAWAADEGLDSQMSMA